MVISHHFLRRRARAKARKLATEFPQNHYYVEPAVRGPFRWRVIRK